VTSAIKCSMGVSVVAEGRVAFALKLSMLSLILICLELLRTREYDIRTSNASIFVRNGN